MLAVAVLAGLIVLGGALWAGPGMYQAGMADDEARVVEATVAVPASCAVADAKETVRFQLDGATRSGILSACGHDRDERLTVAVPQPAGPGVLQVRAAAVSRGYSTLNSSIGLGLIALSCVAGGGYAFLLARPRRLAIG